MNDIWGILQLEPTQDVNAIRRAYAQQVRNCHPEEDPAGFLRLREAYRRALAYAEGTAAFLTREEEKPAGEPDTGWSIATEEETGPNPYLDHEATRNFLELYTGKQRKNSKLWLEYFISPAFLDVFRDSRFTELLRDHVVRLETEYPPPREFLIWLYIAYQMTACKRVYLIDPDHPEQGQRTEVEFQVSDGAMFDGIRAIFEAAVRGPIPRKPQKNELAILTSFQEYDKLVRLAEEGVWGEQAAGEYSQIIGRYAPGCMTDQCVGRGDRDIERHPAGLRMITHFFEKYSLPEEQYRILWEKLELRSALMGRAKIWYGRLREIVLTHVPALAEEPAESFRDLHKAFMGLHLGGDPEENRPLLDNFFARPDMQRALRNRRFIEENILRVWTGDWEAEDFLERIRLFYLENPAAPCAERVIERVESSLNVKRQKRRRLEDEQAPTDILTLKNRSFFRHWLHTAFSNSRHSSPSIRRCLNGELSYLPQWSRRFLEVEEGVIPAPRTITCQIDGDVIEIRFHLYYIDFLLNGAPVYRPFLDWDRLLLLEDTDLFCFLLPVTVSVCGRFEEVREEIRRRLQETAVLPDPDSLASGLAGQVCCLELPDTDLSAVFPLEFFAEDTEQLYGCTWYENEQFLRVFMLNASSGQIFVKGEYDNVYDAQSAVSLGRLLLDGLVNPTAFPMELLQTLPEEVYLDPDYNVIVRREGIASGAKLPRWLLGEEVTSERLEQLLELFSTGCLNRLEFTWAASVPAGEEQECGAWRSLVFLKDAAGYACLYFDDFRAQSYALLARPELYGQSKGVSFVDFRDGELSARDVHKSFVSIRRQLPVIFRQAGQPNNIKYMAGRIWDYAVNVTHGRHKYNLDKQLLGGFPPERIHNNHDARFYFADYPDSAVWPDGTLEVGERNREQLQQVLARFLKGGIPKLRLTWGTGTRKHIVLLEDRGRFLLVWLDEAKQKAVYHVADRWTYMDVEGRKYPKDVFQGRTVPAYLIHGGVIPLRNALEQLLAKLPEPDSITGRIAEYAPEKPVKARPYEAIWAELTGESAISPESDDP